MSNMNLNWQRTTRKGADLMTMIIITLIAVVIGVLVVTQWDSITNRVTTLAGSQSINVCVNEKLCKEGVSTGFTGCYDVSQASTPLQEQGRRLCTHVFDNAGPAAVQGDLHKINASKGAWVKCENGEPINLTTVYNTSECKNNPSKTY